MSERFDELVINARRWGRLPLLARAVIAAGAAGAIIATATPGWDVPDAYLIIAAVAGVVGVIDPDAGGAAFCTGAVVVAWATGSPGAVSPAAVVTALCLLLVHVASALAAAMPVTARGDIGLVLRWVRPTAAIAGGTLATAGLAAILDRWSPPGSIVLVLLALAVLGLGAWWLTSGADR
jgi:hypothetical protein